MKIAFAATNPCHLFPFAKELFAAGNLDRYYSGYPRWKLPTPALMPVTSFPLRTLITYGLLRFPRTLRPKDRQLFRWQDRHFDQKTAKNLNSADAIHGIPGQCLKTFTRARELGITTVLNHATGPAQHLRELLQPEFERVGLSIDSETVYDSEYFEQEKQEYGLADFHCVASSIVKQQLVEHSGIPSDKIWVVPYSADSSIFHPPVTKTGDNRFRIIFAGQTSLRKGVRFLTDALQQIGDSNFELHFYGPESPETQKDIADYKGATELKFFGAVSQNQLAEAFRSADVLVLPSIEEGFGLVVPQALSCGLPCIVSSAVGASDLIEHRVNGSIFKSQNSSDLATELIHWQQHRQTISRPPSWEKCAETLSDFHQSLI